MTMRKLVRVALCLAALIIPAAQAQISDNAVRIGVMTDESGPYADSAGAGSVLAARMAAEDFGGAVRGKPIEILHADTLNKPDVATATARRWFDADGVDAIIDLPVTPIALAVQEIAKQKNRTVMITAAAASEFTSKFCSPVSTHWAETPTRSPPVPPARCWRPAATPGSSSPSTRRSASRWSGMRRRS